MDWQKIDENHHRAPAPVFGSVRIGRYGTSSPWEVSLSVPGYEAELLSERFDQIEDAKRAASGAVRAACREFLETTT